ncbi:MAG TPA: hypothetical protein EYP53_09230 [Candidatus Latescibacteria bacterium]|nr:hypothetical protein [Candidatus Latescibacterota bacterium]
MTLYDKNMKLLGKVDPGLCSRLKEESEGIEVKISKIGLPVPKIGRISLHSSYDPLGEAEILIRSQMPEGDGPGKKAILVLGLGFGYHIKELLKRVETQTPIFVVEPSLGILRCAMEYVDLEDILTKTHLLIGKRADGLFEERGLRRIFEGLGSGGLELVTIVHHPSLRINEDYFHKLTRIINRQRFLSMGRLRILVVYPIYGGSLPIAHYCTQALKDMGHEVEVLDNSVYKQALDSIERITDVESHLEQLRGLFTCLLSEAAMARCLKVKPDLVFALAQAPLNREVLERLRQLGIPTAFWFVEDFRFFDYWRKIAPHYDYFFTIQRGEFFEELERIGVKNYHYLPLAASPKIHRKVRLRKEEQREFSSDISFIGAGYYNRRNFFPSLLDFDFRIWGDGWDISSPLGRVIQRSGQRITSEECVKIFCASKINLNLHSSSYHNGVNPNGDFVNPRTFEIAAAGGFQLVDFRSELPELFEIGKEIITYSDIDDLRAKIEYYLDHPLERKRIASRAKKRVAKDHTYEARMREMLEFIYEREERLGAKGQEGERVSELIRQARGDSELGRFLTRFKGRDRLTLKDIVQEIRKGKGELTRPEGVFLLMYEIWDWAKEKKVI